MNHSEQPTEYVVICRVEAEPKSVWPTGTYELATRTVFPTLEAAQDYANSIAESRKAMVIPGRWRGLRWDAEQRFQTCGACGEPGHNRKTCREAPTVKRRNLNARGL